MVHRIGDSVRYIESENIEPVSISTFPHYIYFGYLKSICVPIPCLKVKKSESYLAGRETMPTICAVMAWSSTGMITSSGASATDLGTFLVLDSGIGGGAGMTTN
jgi:hypothetical protein